MEKRVPRQFGERRWRGSRGRRELRLVSRPSVSLLSLLPSPVGPCLPLGGGLGPRLQIRDGSEGKKIKERGKLGWLGSFTPREGTQIPIPCRAVELP